MPVSGVQEIQAALPKLSRAEIEQIREWIDDYLEDRLEVSDNVKAKLINLALILAGAISRHAARSNFVAAALQIWSATHRAFAGLLAFGGEQS